MAIVILGAEIGAISGMVVEFDESIRISAQPTREWTEAFFAECRELGLGGANVGIRFDLGQGGAFQDGDIHHVEVRRRMQVVDHRALWDQRVQGHLAGRTSVPAAGGCDQQLEVGQDQCSHAPQHGRAVDPELRRSAEEIEPDLGDRKDADRPPVVAARHSAGLTSECFQDSHNKTPCAINPTQGAIEKPKYRRLKSACLIMALGSPAHIRWIRRDARLFQQPGVVT